MKPAPSDRWEHLGALLIQRRTQLSPRFHNRGAFCEATGLKYRLVYDIEEARRANFGASTLAAIEAAYRLEPGAIARFLAGGELEPRPLQSLPPAVPALRIVPDDPGLTPFIEDVFADLAEAMRKYGPGFTPTQAFGKPHEATVWASEDDIPDPRRRARIIAEIRRTEAEWVAGHERNAL